MAEEDGLLFVRLTVRLAIGAPFADCHKAGITDVQILDKGILAEREGFEPSVQVLARTTV